MISGVGPVQIEPIIFQPASTCIVSSAVWAFRKQTENSKMKFNSAILLKKLINL